MLLVPIEELVALLSGGNLHEARLEIEQLFHGDDGYDLDALLQAGIGAQIALDAVGDLELQVRLALVRMAIDRLAQGISGTRAL